MVQGIFLASEGKLHLGFRAGDARFTNEQCNLAKSNEAGNLEEWPEGIEAPEEWNGLERCELCFPNG